MRRHTWVLLWWAAGCAVDARDVETSTGTSRSEPAATNPEESNSAGSGSTGTMSGTAPQPPEGSSGTMATTPITSGNKESTRDAGALPGAEDGGAADAGGAPPTCGASCPNPGMGSGQPDLIVSSLVQSLPNPIPADFEVSYSATISNIGILTAPASTASFQVGGSLVLLPVPALQPGQAETLTRSTTFGSMSSFLITVIADSDDTIREASESNNQAVLTTMTGGAPDLVVSSLTAAPQTPALNATVTYTASIRNDGASTSAPCNLSFQVGGSLGSFTVPALAPNATFVQTRTATFLDTIAILVTAIVDADGIIPESDETNNRVQIQSRI